jgi:hypothetical protein
MKVQLQVTCIHVGLRRKYGFWRRPVFGSRSVPTVDLHPPCQGRGTRRFVHHSIQRRSAAPSVMKALNQNRLAQPRTASIASAWNNVPLGRCLLLANCGGVKPIWKFLITPRVEPGACMMHIVNLIFRRPFRNLIPRKVTSYVGKPGPDAQ